MLYYVLLLYYMIYKYIYIYYIIQDVALHSSSVGVISPNIGSFTSAATIWIWQVPEFIRGSGTYEGLW